MSETQENVEEALEETVYIERKRILFFGLPWTFTRYTLTDNLVTVSSGLLKTTEDDCYMYKIQDVRLTISFAERLFGLGTVVCYTGDVTHPELKLIHIRHAKEIKAFLLEASEAARLKRRTLSTMNIGAHPGMDLDHDGMPDDME